MNCPSCANGMETLALANHAGAALEIDVCRACHAFWFDARESLHLAPASTLRLFALIGETTGSRTPLGVVLKCPRCHARLIATNDIQRNTSFQYFRCVHGHGRLITFFNFLREKDFVRPLSAQQIAELEKTVQFVNCSNCGGPVDLAKGSSCAHCGTPLSILDSKQAEAAVAQLKKAAEPRPIDPTLPLELARARREVEVLFADSGSDYWKNAASSGLVEASLGALLAWLKK
jgi:hypothetical protein